MLTRDMDWQPISTVPREGGILVTTFPPGEDGYRIIHIRAHGIEALRERGLRGITHWMPEPPPPEGVAPPATSVVQPLGRGVDWGGASSDVRGAGMRDVVYGTRVILPGALWAVATVVLGRRGFHWSWIFVSTLGYVAYTLVRARREIMDMICERSAPWVLAGTSAVALVGSALLFLFGLALRWV